MFGIVVPSKNLFVSSETVTIIEPMLRRHQETALIQFRDSLGVRITRKDVEYRKSGTLFEKNSKFRRLLANDRYGVLRVNFPSTLSRYTRYTNFSRRINFSPSSPVYLSVYSSQSLCSYMCTFAILSFLCSHEGTRTCLPLENRTEP